MNIYRTIKHNILSSFAILLANLFTISIVSPQTVYKQTEVRNGGKITGIVKFVGSIPPTARFEVTKNPDHCGLTKPFDRLIIGKNYGVKKVSKSAERFYIM